MGQYPLNAALSASFSIVHNISSFYNVTGITVGVDWDAGLR